MRSKDSFVQTKFPSIGQFDFTLFICYFERFFGETNDKSTKQSLLCSPVTYVRNAVKFRKITQCITVERLQTQAKEFPFYITNKALQIDFTVCCDTVIRLYLPLCSTMNIVAICQYLQLRDPLKLLEIFILNEQRLSKVVDWFLVTVDVCLFLQHMEVELGRTLSYTSLY